MQIADDERAVESVARARGVNGINFKTRRDENFAAFHSRAALVAERHGNNFRPYRPESFKYLFNVRLAGQLGGNVEVGD